jgi:peptide/nickel transport system permease protein
VRRVARHHPMAVLGAVIIAAWLTIGVLAPMISPFPPVEQNLRDRFSPPDGKYLFGTDKLGRDIFSRVMHGARVSLPVGVAVVIVAGSVGTTIGAVAGFGGRWLDEILMRLSDLVISFPSLILAMAVSAALGPSLQNSMLAIVSVAWPKYARLMRGLVLSAKENDYVSAARAIGASPRRILFRAILPNCLAPTFILATLDLGTAILIFSGLGFLGLGQVPPNPEWGAMIADGANAFQYWWVGTFPGLAIFSVCLGFNFVGDALRDLLDPRLRGTMN